MVKQELGNRVWALRAQNPMLEYRHGLKGGQGIRGFGRAPADGGGNGGAAESDAVEMALFKPRMPGLVGGLRANYHRPGSRKTWGFRLD